MPRTQEQNSMTVHDWLDHVGTRVGARVADVQISRPDDDSLGLSRGLRAVQLQGDGDRIFVGPSIASGGTLASRLQDRVQQLEFQQYGVEEATVEVAVDAIVTHLRN